MRRRLAATAPRLPLVDAVALDDLAARCEQLHRYSSPLTVAPPRIRALTGIPVNPIAAF
ncbi:hypothetical protein GCM10009834_36040 [Streptomonospora arabica]